MSFAEKHIISVYSLLFEGLNPVNKIELIECLTKSLKKEMKNNEADFYSSFGAFGSEKPAEDIIKDIKNNRKFKNRDTDFA